MWRVCGWESYNVEHLVLEWTGFGGGGVASARGNRRTEILHVSRRVSG